MAPCALSFVCMNTPSLVFSFPSLYTFFWTHLRVNCIHHVPLPLKILQSVFPKSNSISYVTVVQLFWKFNIDIMLQSSVHISVWSIDLMIFLIFFYSILPPPCSTTFIPGSHIVFSCYVFFNG